MADGGWQDGEALASLSPKLAVISLRICRRKTGVRMAKARAEKQGGGRVARDETHRGILWWVSALCWALSAMAQTRLVRRLLPWVPHHGVPYVASAMTAWAAGTASIAALAQVFPTSRD
ncbi:hypothetical protein ACRBEV_14070 [Methylobacterium phyllosphaerae]